MVHRPPPYKETENRRHIAEMSKEVAAIHTANATRSRSSPTIWVENWQLKAPQEGGGGPGCVRSAGRAQAALFMRLDVATAARLPARNLRYFCPSPAQRDGAVSKDQVVLTICGSRERGTARRLSVSAPTRRGGSCSNNKRAAPVNRPEDATPTALSL